jgi:NTE family protein
LASRCRDRPQEVDRAIPELALAAAGQISPISSIRSTSTRCGLLLEEVDFEAVRKHSPVRLLVSATRVQDGSVRIFHTKSISLEVVLASACLPKLHHAFEIDGEPHWDGGFGANPPPLPVIAESRTRDVLLVQVIPTDHPDLPVTKSEIDTRVGRLTFNSPLRHDLATVELMQNLIREEGPPTSRLGRNLDDLRLHTISAEGHVDGLRDLSILNTDWTISTHLRDRGRMAAGAWLSAHAARHCPTSGGQKLTSRAPPGGRS